MFTVLNGRSTGENQINRGFNKRIDTSTFVECLECYRTDEYLTVGSDDGALVPPIACEFSKQGQGNILAVVDESGGTIIQDTNRTGQPALLSEWQAHSNAIFDLAWVPLENKLVTASGDQTAVLWDVPRAEKLDVFKGHTSSVRTVAFRSDDSAVFATGSRDGHIMIWDTRCNRKDGFLSPVNTIHNAHALQQPSTCKRRNRQKLGPARDSQQSVTVVTFQTDTTLISAGAVDGCVKFWDLRKTYSQMTTMPESRHTIPYSGTSQRKHGFTSLTMDVYRSILFASCTDDIVYQYDITTMQPGLMYQYRGHRNNSFYVKTCISPDNQFLLSGSSDEVAHIWQVGKPNRSPIVLKGHKAEVSDVAWSPNDLSKVVTLSDDNSVRVWRINRRLSPPEQGEVIGTAERTHREIGTSARQTEEKENQEQIFINEKTTYRNKPSKTPNLKKTKSAENSPGSLSNMSPSIKHWLSGKKTPSSKVMANNKSQQSITSDSAGSKSERKRPCKRKLVSDSPDQNPSKRQNVLQELQSPHKSASPTIAAFRNDYGACSKSPVRNSPQKWNSPQKFSSPRKINLNFNSPKKLNLDSPQNKLTNSPSSSSLNKESPKKSNSVRVLNMPLQCITKQSVITASPTADLPNLVLSGEVNRVNVCYPLGKENSPQKGTPPMNWLNQIRQQKLGRDGETNQRLKFSPCRSLFYNSADCSPAESAESSQSNTEEPSHTSSQTEEEPKTPVRGMKSLKHYFQPRPSPKVDPVG
ncbi:LOW QUALITY PROTEIN: denticleless protein homolog [Pecten maximus]|uniref:LOW QUALITY PROTEIN: denticleless protein homolog n=1 Tax=Pecten maximus TaxID=6579 RepID=UPI00145823AA|nr:LOW QUALITY PROTEIN: denticleless protein homolog [Pecten maximus]